MLLILLTIVRYYRFLYNDAIHQFTMSYVHICTYIDMYKHTYIMDLLYITYLSSSTTNNN